jgi:hypothetical protein
MEPQEYVKPGKEVEFDRLWNKALRAKEELDMQLVPAKYEEYWIKLNNVYQEMFEWGMK